jgi:hypothetical protein
MFERRRLVRSHLRLADPWPAQFLVDNSHKHSALNSFVKEDKSKRGQADLQTLE